MPAALRVAALAMTATADPAANAALIADGLARAAAAGAQILATPECALPGYPGAVRSDLDAADWCALAELEERLLLAAERHGLLLILGTAAPDGEGGIANLAVACGAVAPVRYRKQCLTPGDRRHFSPGPAQATVVEAFGWRLGLSICYDVRAADVWYAQAAAGADAFIHLAHQAGPDHDPGTKAQVLPALYAARAAELATPLLLANTAAADRHLDSAVWDARGARIAAAGEGLLIAELAPRDALHPWYAGCRAMALSRWR
jgi:predicted amidohydrolase